MQVVRILMLGAAAPLLAAAVAVVAYGSTPPTPEAEDLPIVKTASRGSANPASDPDVDTSTSPGPHPASATDPASKPVTTSSKTAKPASSPVSAGPTKQRPQSLPVRTAAAGSGDGQRRSKTTESDREIVAGPVHEADDKVDETSAHTETHSSGDGARTEARHRDSGSSDSHD